MVSRPGRARLRAGHLPAASCCHTPLLPFGAGALPIAVHHHEIGPAARRNPRSSVMRSNGLIRFLILALTAVVLSASAQADDAARTGAINLSRDLVRLGIAASNLRPDNPSLDARPLFQAALVYAKSHAVHAITVDRGTYYVLTP